MASLMDQWYLTGRLAEEEKAARLKNQMVLEEMARVKRQEQDMAQFLAARAQQSQPTARPQTQPTPQPMGGFGEAAGGLTGLGGTPDTNAQGQSAPEGGMPSAAPPIAQTFGQQAPQSPTPKAVDMMRAQIGAFDTEIAKIRQLATPTAYAAEQKLVKEREGVVEKLRMAEKDEFDQKYKEAQDNWDKWSAVKDQQGLDVLTASAPAEFKQKLAMAGLFPNFATGKYDFNDPRMKMFVDNAKGFALTQVQRYEQDKRVKDIENDVENRRLTAKRDEEASRDRKSAQALQRERFEWEKNKEGSASPKEVATRSADLRKEQREALKPIEPLVSNISKIRTFLSTSNTAADRQLNAALTDLDGNVRATNMLFQDNKNFGSLAGKISGFLSQTFTGRYTEEQRAQIRALIDGLDQETKTVRSNVDNYYKDIARQTGVPEGLIRTPNFYGGKDAEAEANAFLSGMGKPKK